MSTNRVAVMNVLAIQTIAGPEAVDGRDHFVLQPPSSLEVRLAARELDEQVANETAHGRFAFRSFDPRPPIDVVRE